MSQILLVTESAEQTGIELARGKRGILHKHGEVACVNSLEARPKMDGGGEC